MRGAVFGDDADFGALVDALVEVGQVLGGFGFVGANQLLELFYGCLKSSFALFIKQAVGDVLAEGFFS